MLCIRSVDGNNVVHSWNPSVMNGAAAKVNKTFFFRTFSTSYIRTVWFPNRKHSKVFTTIFLCLYATNSFTFVLTCIVTDFFLNN